MNEPYIFSLTDQPDAVDRRAVDDGLTAFNEQHAAPENYQPLCVFMRDAKGAVVGGLIGETYWNWLHIDILWLRENVRGSGYGTRIMLLAEDEARRRGCKSVFLDTISFQALDFYVTLGYTLFGQLENFPEGETRYYLQKKL
ncbi:MAG: GNAT family N-acetyltransferase [Burkholderiales bacterium]|nr:GNAT family N-acetyltransferase [Anaerolineae bacterium]